MKTSNAYISTLQYLGKMWPRRIQIDENNWIQTKDECKIKAMHLVVPMIFVNQDQYEIIKEPKNGVKLCSRAESLPRWIPASMIAGYFGYSESGINKAVRAFGRPYMWATEFENVHSTWKYIERPIRVDGHEYQCIESYYQNHKPDPKDMSNQAVAERMKLMKKGVWQKFTHAENSDELLNLLVSTYPNNLVAIKTDVYWGFDAKRGGENQLANILMEIRSDVIHVMKRQLIYDWNIHGLWSSYNTGFLPSPWVRSEHLKHLTFGGSTAIQTQCLTMNPDHKYLDLVLQHREPTNIKNLPGQFNETNLGQGFGYAESGYKTAFRLAKQLELPPNFALLCKTQIRSRGIEEFLRRTQNSNRCYINVVNSIGFAFDTESQPDYIYFIEGNRMHEFDGHLTNMLGLIFAAYVQSGCKMLVLAEIGAGAFSALFPGCLPGNSEAYLTNHFYPCLRRMWQSLKIAPTTILLIGKPSDLSMNELKSVCAGANILACGRFPEVVTQHVRFDTITGHSSLHEFTDAPQHMQHRVECYQLSDALFVNAWDPHSVVGNGNFNDNSLDGHFGRYTDMGPMSFYPTNPDIRIVDAKAILAY